MTTNLIDSLSHNKNDQMLKVDTRSANVTFFHNLIKSRCLGCLPNYALL